MSASVAIHMEVIKGSPVVGALLTDEASVLYFNRKADDVWCIGRSIPSYFRGV